jgi:hypothetical protein
VAGRLLAKATVDRPSGWVYAARQVHKTAVIHGASTSLPFAAALDLIDAPEVPRATIHPKVNDNDYDTPVETEQTKGANSNSKWRDLSRKRETRIYKKFCVNYS